MKITWSVMCRTDYDDTGTPDVWKVVGEYDTHEKAFCKYNSIRANHYTEERAILLTLEGKETYIIEASLATGGKVRSAVGCKALASDAGLLLCERHKNPTPF